MLGLQIAADNVDDRANLAALARMTGEVASGRERWQ